jgi:hypothetical protein
MIVVKNIADGISLMNAVDILMGGIIWSHLAMVPGFMSHVSFHLAIQKQRAIVCVIQCY